MNNHCSCKSVLELHSFPSFDRIFQDINITYLHFMAIHNKIKCKSVIMKIFIIVCCAFIGLVLADTPKYTTKYDNVDLEEIIKSDRLMKNYVNCLLEKGKCTPDGAELKRVLPDALHTECSKCSDSQKKGSRKIMRHLIDNKPEWWTELENKYDKEGAYKKQYREELKKDGIKL
ncbi:hypothetical protein HUJ04_004523 [Dendroctonus ponderosae]|uniref:Uncharacterized protein n=2 Tax=Dendroctonus ponderosae TaxID=77166 RepID=A0AAR5PAS1_DENPD|nr:hypothetical protein HUJ04_004523 [Dendroctonus ponderosae]